MSEAASIKVVSGSDRTLDQQEIDSHERLVLSERDRDLFISVMSNPPQLSSKRRKGCDRQILRTVLVAHQL
ncbi:MAG: hypothetical protein GDA43_02175 [Hormoscilla sp. SP5CHS1]|nr:hypothetical protein [Hormoscilla sp. SP5CHS1]